MARESKREKQLREHDETRHDETRRAETDRRAIASHLEQPAPLGCGDSSCVVAAARGMTTNGGCRCSPRALQAAVLWYRFEYKHRADLAQRRS
jgi:hypothetical protein